MNQFPPSPEYPIMAVLNFFRKLAGLFTAQGAPQVSLTPVAKGQNFQSEKF
jgi:hypothetical protein